MDNDKTCLKVCEVGLRGYENFLKTEISVQMQLKTVQGGTGNQVRGNQGAKISLRLSNLNPCGIYHLDRSSCNNVASLCLIR